MCDDPTRADVQQLEHEFQNLLTTSRAGAQAQTAYTVELTLFRRLLVGAMLLRLSSSRGQHPSGEPVTGPMGRVTTRAARDHVLFGVWQGALWRHAFTAPGHQGLCPRRELSLRHTAIRPAARVGGYGTTDEYARARRARTHLGGIAQSQASRLVWQRPGKMSRPSMSNSESTTPLVGRWWCKRMAKGCDGTAPLRRIRALGKGQKRTKKKEGRDRTLQHCPYCAPAGSRGGLLQDLGARAGAPPPPVGKELRARWRGRQRHELFGAASASAMGPHSAARRAHRWREALQQQVVATFRRTP